MNSYSAVTLVLAGCIPPSAEAVDAAARTPVATSVASPRNNATETDKPPLSSGLDFGHGLTYQTGNGNFKVRLNAALQVDAAVFQPDRSNLEDDLGVRRAQFAITGNLYGDLSYGTVIDVTTGDASFQDALLRYTGWQPLHFTLGQFKQPFSLEWLTTSRNITFLERALPNIFVPGYHLGFAMDSQGRHWTAAASIFENDIDGTGNDGDGWGAAARYAFAPVASKTRTLHFGLGTVYRDLTGSDDRLRFRVRPEARLTDIRFVDTRNISNTDDYLLLGLEGAAVFGSLSLQTEYIRAWVNRKGRREDPEFTGWYVYGSWFVTGEARRYVKEQGRFDRVRPQRPMTLTGGTGAWELAARYSQVDLNDAGIRGGDEQNWTLAINFYPTAYTRVMANYVFVSSNRRGEDDPMIFEIRFQAEF